MSSIKTNWGIVKPKYECLQDILKKMNQVVIAFSGGTDSTLLLKIARNVLGDNVMAVTTFSETMPKNERKDALKLSQSMSVSHLCIGTYELGLPEFIKNPENKCYICKKCKFIEIISQAKSRGFYYVADGENFDDKQDYRPGSLAAKELGIRSPLREAGFTKTEIRFLSKKLNLPTWNKPAYACLASRIPYHQMITVEKLKQIEDGENFIRKLGISDQIRVRHEGDTARIEVRDKDISKFIENETRQIIINYFKSSGFKFIALDLEGYAMGSLNRGIND